MNPIPPWLVTWQRIRYNPLYALYWRRWERRQWTLLLLAALSFMVCIAALFPLWAFPLVTGMAYSGAGLDDYRSAAQWLQFAGLPLLHLLTGAGLAVLAAVDVRRAEASGEYDMLRLAGIKGGQMAELFLVRNLLRAPVWVIVIPCLPLHFFIYVVYGTPLLPPGLWCAPLALVLGGLQVAQAAAQLLACTAIGIRAGQKSATWEGGLGRALARAALFEIVVPYGVMGALLGVCFVPVLMMSYGPISIYPDLLCFVLLIALFWILLLRYQLYVFRSQRDAFDFLSEDPAVR